MAGNNSFLTIQALKELLAHRGYDPAGLKKPEMNTALIDLNQERPASTPRESPFSLAAQTGQNVLSQRVRECLAFYGPYTSPEVVNRIMVEAEKE
ncbi:Hypothetical predicted protein [Pelobates cultripes]|uniref:Uncharacterized protein n=1 Tax=Pelobates cultripes TaxID=61616 RepID=A0AAD1SQ19_PELCU|nr:Hypothetical predicted protein [Pelobates cultripes]